MHKLPVSENLLALFWDLAEANDDKRCSSAVKLIKIIDEVQKGEEPCKELEYSITRLVKGLSSNRRFARIGYVLALTQLMRTFRQVSVTSVLQLVNEHLKTNSSDTKTEQSDTLIGRNLAYLAIVESGRLQDLEEEVIDITRQLAAGLDGKRVVQLFVTQGLVRLISKLSTEVFQTTSWTVLEKILQCGWQDCSPNKLLLLWTAHQSHPSLVDKEFLKQYWAHSHLLHKSNMSNLADVIMASTYVHPVIHSVIPAIISDVLKKSATLSVFWSEVVEAHLLKNTPQRTYLAFEIASLALSQSSTVEQVTTVLCPSLISSVKQILSHDSDPLNPAAKKLLENVITFHANCDGSDMQLAVLQKFIIKPATLRFDIVTKTSTVGRLVRSLKDEATYQFLEAVMSVIRGEDPDLIRDEDAPDRQSIINWAIVQLHALVSQSTISLHTDIQTSILKFIALHGLFNVTKDIKDAGDIGRACKLPLISESQFRLRDMLIKSAARLATINPEKASRKSHGIFCDILYDVVSFISALMNNKLLLSTTSVTIKPEIREEVQKVILKLKSLREDTSSLQHEAVKSSKTTESVAFQMLYLNFVLQLWVGDASVQDATLEALKDLHICVDKAKLKTKKKKSEGQDEPEWVEVVTEMLLSLLSQPSNAVRSVVTTVFAMLCPHITAGALQLILDVLKPRNKVDDKEGDDDDEFVTFEGDDVNGEVEENGDVEMDEESEEEEEEEEEEKEMSIDEKARREVKAALGNAAVDSDEEESDEDLNDEEMIKRDEALAAAFKSLTGRKQEEKEKEMQLKNFKLRCLGLIQTFVQHSPSSSLVLELLMPLLQLIDEGQRDKNKEEVGNKAKECLRVACSSKRVIFDEKAESTFLFDCFKQLLEFSRKVGTTLLQDITVAAVFVIHAISALSVTDCDVESYMSPTDNSETPSDNKKPFVNKLVRLMRHAVRDYCNVSDSSSNPFFLQAVLERQPVLLWSVSSELMKHATNEEVRVYRRVQACRMLTSMIKKNTVKELGSELWEKFLNKNLSQLTQLINSVCQMNTAKPKLVQESLSLYNQVLTQCTKELMEKFELDESLLIAVGKMKMEAPNKDIKRQCTRLLDTVKRLRMPQHAASQSTKRRERRIKHKLQANDVVEINASSNSLELETTDELVTVNSVQKRKSILKNEQPKKKQKKLQK